MGELVYARRENNIIMEVDELSLKSDRRCIESGERRKRRKSEKTGGLVK